MGLLENIRVEPASRLALREPVTASAQTTIREAVELMRAKRLGCVILVDEEQHPQGMFTESMLTQLLVRNPAAVDELVSDHASQQWPWVKLTDKVGDVLDALEAKGVRFLAVLDDGGRLAGLTGQKGLMEYVAEHFPGEVMVQRIGSKPYTKNREGG